MYFREGIIYGDNAQEWSFRGQETKSLFSV